MGAGARTSGRRRRAGTVALLLALTVPALGGAGERAAGADPLASEVSSSPSARTPYCQVTVLDQRPDGELVTSELSCSSSPLVAPLSTEQVAVHFDHHDYGGSYLRVFASGCLGGWWNLPSAWNDRISSTFSHCTVRHYRNANLGGTVYTTPPYDGNIFGSMNNDTTSARYG